MRHLLGKMWRYSSSERRIYFTPPRRDWSHKDTVETPNEQHSTTPGLNTFLNSSLLIVFWCCFFFHPALYNILKNHYAMWIVYDVELIKKTIQVIWCVKNQSPSPFSSWKHLLIYPVDTLLVVVFPSIISQIKFTVNSTQTSSFRAKRRFSTVKVPDGVLTNCWNVHRFVRVHISLLEAH